MMSLIGDCTTGMLGYTESEPNAIVWLLSLCPGHQVLSPQLERDMTIVSHPRYVSMRACYFPAGSYCCGYKEEGTHKNELLLCPVYPLPPFCSCWASILRPLKQTLIPQERVPV